MERIKELILGYLRQELTAEEARELEIWLAGAPPRRALLADLQDPEALAEALAKLDRLDKAGAWKRVKAYSEAAQGENAPMQTRQLMARGRGWMAAAAVLLALAVGGFLWQQSRRAKILPVAEAPVMHHDVPPGSSKAILTLAGGTQIVLDSAQKGTLTQQGGTRIVKTGDGKIVYDILDQKPTATLYNRLVTPRGGQFQLTLPDGTKVWLNAASSIRYPVFFSGSERRVDVTGEAYFEVVKNTSQPFKVIVDKRLEVEVLGTSFNVNGYDDEQKIATTLLQGSVRVALVGVNTNKEKLSVVLQPGEQARLVVGENAGDRGENLTVDKAANIEQAVAWKNGTFAFRDADLQTVMRQLARWYDVDVTYEGQIEKREFNGKIGRSLTLDQVLKVLTRTRVHYTIDGKLLTIRP